MPQTPPPQNKALSTAARTLQLCNRPFGETEILETLEQQLAASLIDDDINIGILHAQTQVLDALFHRIITKALTQPYNPENKSSTYVDPDYLNLALRTQKQCRTTIETLKLHRVKK